MHHVPQLLFRCFRKLFLQYRDTAIHEFLHGSIGKFSVRITPFAVIFIETAVLFLTEQSIIIQRHTAALTKQSLRHPQKCIDGHMKFFGNEFQCFRVWNGFSRFPATHCLLTSRRFAISSWVSSWSFRNCSNTSFVSIQPHPFCDLIVPDFTDFGKQPAVAYASKARISAKSCSTFSASVAQLVQKRTEV